MPRLCLAVDIGGTFTDIIIHDEESGAHYIWKEATTTEGPERGVLTGVSRILDRHSLNPGDIGRVIHATTLFTNALIERKGVKTGLITTKGFRDILEIQTERKYELYDIGIERPSPLVPRYLRREVPERMTEKGAVETRLDLDAVAREAAFLAGEGVESIAIAFLHSYSNPAHEQAAINVVRMRHPEISVTGSADIAPEIREYERTSTAVANAYVKPIAEKYLDRLAQKLRDLGIPGALFLMLSNGGLTNVDEARRAPIRLLESGPAAGVLAAIMFGGESAADGLIAFDMGGTTAKASLVDGSKPLITHIFETGRAKRFMEGSGLPIIMPSIELIEIGAGGGSIARIDELALLKVGPDSAASFPGPACYRRGGKLPTVTDADLLLGYLNPEYFLGGEMNVDIAAARDAVQALADSANLDLMQAAWGIHDVVNENMAAATRVHFAKQGRDPRRYALVATGGAGPVHAYNMATKVNLSRVICPSGAGVGSALGMLAAPARIDRVAMHVCPLHTVDWNELEALYRKLEQEAGTVLEKTGAAIGHAVIQRMADMRYAGQSSELTVALPPGPYSADSETAFTVGFESAYRTLFVRTPPNVPISIVNVRLSMSAPMTDELTIRHADASRSDAPALKGRRQVYFAVANGFTDTPVFDRYRLKPSITMDGPAIIEERESTFVIGPGSTFIVDARSNIVVTLPIKGS